jgi:selenide,water dikinase
VRAAISSRGIHCRLGRRVTRAAEGTLHFADGTSIDADWIVWATGAAAPPWLRESGLALDPAGFVLVDATLRSVSHPAVHAAGDVATAKDHPHPKSGVYAVRQGPPLFANLMRALDREKPQPWVPQPRTLALLSTGDGAAIASWGPFAMTGAWAWWWKDRIDRAFMARYRGAAVAR